jgi:hypothetical protein
VRKGTNNHNNRSLNQSSKVVVPPFLAATKKATVGRELKNLAVVVVVRVRLLVTLITKLFVQIPVGQRI